MGNGQNFLLGEGILKLEDSDYELEGSMGVVFNLKHKGKVVAHIAMIPNPVGDVIFNVTKETEPIPTKVINAFKEKAQKIFEEMSMETA